MKKANEDLVNEYAKKVQAGEMTLEQVQKELQEKKQQLQQLAQNNQDSTNNPPKVVEPATEVPPAKELKIPPNMFRPFTLGSTLVPGPLGHTLSNVKPSVKKDK